MSNITNALRTLKGAGKPATGVLAALTLACLGLTACGGSSGSSTNAAATGASATGASTASTSTGGTASSSTGSQTATGGQSSTSTGPTAAQGSGARSGRFAATRECLQKNGITLPTRPSGAGDPAGGGLPGAGGGSGGPRLPKGVTRTQFEAALKKCGGTRFGARGGGFRRTNSPIFKQSLSRFATCLRQNGVNIPAPNTSGNGPIFNTKGIDTKSPQFKAATVKCRSVLLGSFRRPQGAGGAPGTGGAPPAGQAQGGESSG
jgi:hypothetical protein